MGERFDRTEQHADAEMDDAADHGSSLPAHGSRTKSRHNREKFSGSARFQGAIPKKRNNGQ
jgi:hypothetical protein